MHRVRLLVLWIMMIAVPFQGYAAAAMIYCGPGHAGATAAVSAEPSAVHNHAQHQHQHGDGLGDKHQNAKPPANDDGGKSASAAHDTLHKCSTCGACHATALTSTLQLAVFHDLPSADLAEPAIAMATLAPRVLDKPPRA